MIARLFLGMLGCMMIALFIIAQALNMRWKVAKIQRAGYRKLNEDLEIRHQSEIYKHKSNDFARLPSHPKDEDSSEEDDLDDINMDIYADLVDAGKKYLDTYEQARDGRKKKEKGKRRDMYLILKDLEKQLEDLTNDAKANDMQVFDPVALHDDSDDEKYQEKQEIAK
jgi:hypothetical protein